jgi:hypothetical protein
MLRWTTEGRMIAIVVLLLLVAAVVALIVMGVRGRGAPHPRPLAEQLARWVRAGIIDDLTAERIDAYERAAEPVGAVAPDGPAVHTAVPTGAPAGSAPAATPRPARRERPRAALSAVIEALGYLGGVLAVSGVVLLVAHYWTDLALGGRLALSGVTAAALAGAGLAVPERRNSAMARLRAFLWTLATASVGVFAAVAARDLLGDEPAGPVVACTAASVALVSGLMWWGRRRPVQQLLALSAAVVAVGTGLAEPAGSTVAGVAVWAAGAALLALGVRQRTTFPVIDVAVGAIAAAVGSIVAVAAAGDPGIGLLFVVATGAAIVTLALLRGLVTDVASIVALCVIGAITVVQSLPPLVVTMADDAGIVTAAVLWVSGLSVALIGIRRLTRAPLVLEVLGAACMLVACAVAAAQSPGVATIAGLVTSMGLLGVSMLPGRVALSPVGAVGLLAYVPWSIGWFFPGEGRVPLLISVSGLLIIGVAVLMARSGHRFGTELGHRPGHT